MNNESLALTELRVNHGHETEEHRALKRELATVLSRREFRAIFFELHNTDIVAIGPDGVSLLAGEVERSPRNLMNNITRNFAQGCDHVLIVCPNFKTLGEVARKLARELPPSFHSKVGATTLSALKIVTPQK